MAERHVRHVEENSRARGRHFGVLKRIALDMGYDGAPCYTSIRSLARAERCSTHTVEAAVSWAASEGELVVTRVGQRNYYSLPDRGNQNPETATAADDNQKTATVTPKTATASTNRGSSVSSCSSFCENCSSQTATAQLLQLSEKLLQLEKTVAVLAETVAVLAKTVAVFQTGRGSFSENRSSFEANRGTQTATEVKEVLKGPQEVCEVGPHAHTETATVAVIPPKTATAPSPIPSFPTETPVPAHIRGFNAMYAERKTSVQLAMEQTIAGIVRNPTNRQGIADAAMTAIGYDLSPQDVTDLFGDESVFWYQVSHGQRDHLQPYAKNVESELRAAIRWRKNGCLLPSTNGKNGHSPKAEPYSADPEFVEKLNRELNPGWDNNAPIPEIPW